MNRYDEIVRILKENKETISFMESCTGGFLSSTLTNVEGASSVISFSAVTYSNDAKIKMGVEEDVISTSTVYSMEVAKQMAKAISIFASSTYGVGVTGKLGVSDPSNPYGEDNMVYIGIYDCKRDVYIEQTLTVERKDRIYQKEDIATLVSFLLLKYLKKGNNLER